MIHYVIPAREGSKGFPHKNRKLFEHTAKVLYNAAQESVIVSTDDEVIKEEVKGYGFIVHDRPEDLANDEASMKDVLIDIVNASRKVESLVPTMNDSDIIVMLYLTYPQRTMEHIEEALKFYIEKRATSLLCRKIPKTHPYLCVYPDGTQVVSHNKYRRQDYPEIFELSHYITIIEVASIKRLNKNLYDRNTVYFDIEDVIDVDYEKDLEEFENES